jgi:hypothetical protein
MDVAIIIILIVGILMFAGYIFLIYKTSKNDDNKNK